MPRAYGTKDGVEGLNNRNVMYEVDKHTAWLTMNRPQVLNALSKRMFKELENGLGIATKDPDAYSIGIRGSGRAFSAGLDVKEVGGFASHKEAREFVYGLVKPFWERYLTCEKPILSVVHGPAYGAGAEIALASDIVLASSESTFAFSGGRVGALCCISGLLGPLTMNGRKVLEMNLSGNSISAREAQQYGLVSHVVPRSKLLNLTNRILREILHVSPISTASFKRIRRSLVSSDGLNTAYKELLRTITSRDFKKGAKAFTQRKQPDYYNQSRRQVPFTYKPHRQ